MICLEASSPFISGISMSIVTRSAFFSLYFCTGRSSQDVKKLIKQYKTSPYGIAENGGIIINSNLINDKFGDRTEPDKLIKYLSDHE